MDKESQPSKKEDFCDHAIKKESRKLKARRGKEVNLWRGFGLFGLVGWSVIVPVLFGMFMGSGLADGDSGGYAWRLVYLLGGICIGCIFAWLVVTKELFKNEDS